jgi:hypothetical protein
MKNVLDQKLQFMYDCPSYRKRLQPSKENVQHFNALLDPAPDSQSGYGSRDPTESGSTSLSKTKTNE